MANEYTEMSDEQIVHTILSTERDLVGARFQHAQNRLENTAQLRVLRKNIARLQTEARIREVAASLPRDGLVSKYRKSFDAKAVTIAQKTEGGFLAGVVDKMAGEE